MESELILNSDGRVVFKPIYWKNELLGNSFFSQTCLIVDFSVASQIENAKVLHSILLDGNQSFLHY